MRFSLHREGSLAQDQEKAPETGCPGRTNRMPRTCLLSGIKQLVVSYYSETADKGPFFGATGKAIACTDFSYLGSSRHVTQIIVAEESMKWSLLRVAHDLSNLYFLLFQ